MENPFYNDIYDILRIRGSKGLPVSLIAKQVYNRHAGLFNPEFSYDKVYQNVRSFLWAQARKPSSPFTYGEGRGRYALKANICEQMKLEFDDEQDEETKAPAISNKSDDYPMLF